MPNNTKQALYRPTKNLAVDFEFKNDEHEEASVLLEAKSIHAQLFAACDDFKKRRKEFKKNGKLVYTTKVNDVNFSAAAFTLLYGTTNIAEGYLGEDVLTATFALTGFTKERLMTCSGTYDPDTSYNEPAVTSEKNNLRNTDFNTRLEQRIRVLKGATSYDVGKAIVTVAELKTAIEKGNFHGVYHHTEQAEMDLLSSPQGIKQLTSKLQELDAEYAYGGVLDIFTDRPLCSNCNVGLMGIQRSQEQGFLSEWSKVLKKAHIDTRENDNFMLSVRVSTAGGNEPFLAAPDVVHQYNPDEKCVIYQAKNTQFGAVNYAKTKGYTLSTFPGSIFTSKKVSAQKMADDIALPLDEALPALELA